MSRAGRVLVETLSVIASGAKQSKIVTLPSLCMAYIKVIYLSVFMSLRT